MSLKRTREEIEAEIESLRYLAPRINPLSFFGDDNRTAVDAQIEVLSELLDEDEIDERHDDAGEGEVFSTDHACKSARHAARWLEGEADSKPSAGWIALVQ